MPAFTQRFAEAGYAIFAFDYRGFGESEGWPRHWVSPKRHLEDWQAALNFVKTIRSFQKPRFVKRQIKCLMHAITCDKAIILNSAQVKFWKEYCFATGVLKGKRSRALGACG
ncbi:MAG: alpha/beta hydrolase, partial [Acinetobacter sp.]